jgi:hypothetical protein
MTFGGKSARLDVMHFDLLRDMGTTVCVVSLTRRVVKTRGFVRNVCGKSGTKLIKPLIGTW